MSNHLCPCCGRHCYLDEVQCERGAEYKETGVIPPRKPRPDGNGERKKPSEKKMQYLALDREGKLAQNLRELGEKVAVAENASDIFDVLRDEDRNDLLLLLEKLKHGLHHKAKK